MPRLWTTALVLGLSVLAPSPASGSSTIQVGKRGALFLLFEPGNAPGANEQQGLRATIDSVFLPATGLAASDAEQLGIPAGAIAKCKEQQSFGCWVRLARESPRQEVPFVLLVSSIDLGPSMKSVTAIAVDVARGEAVLDRMATSPLGPTEEIENFIFEEAVFSKTERLPDRDEASRGAFYSAFLREARLKLSSFADWKPRGSLRLATAASDLLVYLDGRLVGTSRDGEATLLDVDAGMHSIQIEDPEGALTHRPEEVEITAGRTTSFHARLSASDSRSAVRSVLFWVGLASLAAGSAVLLAEALEPPPTMVCLRGSCAREVEDLVGAVPPAAVGGALFGLGAGWAGGVMLIGEEWELPWVPLIAGLVLGGAGGALGKLAEPEPSPPG